MQASFVAFILIGLGVTCESAPPPNQSGDEKEKLRKEVVRLRRELLDLKLKNARDSKDEAEELRLLHEEGLKADPYEEVQTYALTLMTALSNGRRVKAAQFVIRELPNLSPAVHGSALGFLSHAGTADARAAVLAGVKHESAIVRQRAAEALLRSPGESTINALHGLLSDSNRKVQDSAINGLGTLRNKSSVAPLIRFIRTTKVPELKEKAIGALGNIGGAEAVDPIIEALEKNGNEGVQYAAINALGKIGVVNDRVREAILPYLEGERSILIREIAIRALGKFKDQKLLPRLREHLTSKEARLRAAAFQAIAFMAGDEDRILEEDLMAALQSEKDKRASDDMWNAVVLFAGTDFNRLTRVAEGSLIRNAGLDRVQQLADKLSKLDIGGDEDRKKKYTTILEALAAAQEKAGEHRNALAHYRTLNSLHPDIVAYVRGSARCHRVLKEFDTGLRILTEAVGKVKVGNMQWWYLKMDALAIRDHMDDHPETARAAFELVNTTHPPPDGAMREKAAASYDTAVSALFRQFDQKDVQQKITALGRIVIAPLADALEDEGYNKHHDIILSIGNAITGTRVADHAKAAAAWRKWLSNGK